MIHILGIASNLLSAGNLFFFCIFVDSVFAGKHIIPDTKHYCKNGSLFACVVRSGLYVNQFKPNI
jgi:hypothetical protein